MSQPDANSTPVPRWGFGLALLALLLIVGGFVFFQSDYFLLRHIVITGRCALPKEELIDRAGLSRRINLFQMDLPQLRENILMIPEVRRVELTRRLPGTLRIHLEPREPFCLVAVKRGLFKVGRDGVVLETCESGKTPDLPVLIGLHNSPLTINGLKKFNDPLFFQGIEVLSAAGAGLRADLSEVDLTRFRLYTVDSIQVELGDLSQITEKMAALRALLAGGDRKKIIGIDLRVPSQPVILNDTGPAKP